MKLIISQVALVQAMFLAPASVHYDAKRCWMDKIHARAFHTMSLSTFKDQLTALYSRGMLLPKLALSRCDVLLTSNMSDRQIAETRLAAETAGGEPLVWHFVTLV